MRLKRTLSASLALLLGLLTPPGFPAFDPVNDDTDIFLANPQYNVNRPNVLIILDNTANWNTPFDAEKTALVNAVNGLGDQFNVGLMMFTETGAGNGSPDGGYVKFGVRQMTVANKAVLADMVGNLDKLADKSNGGKTALAMYEAFQYYGGTTAYAGANKVKRDYNGNASNTAGSVAGNALPNAGATTYTSPITDGCQKNFIIYISNGPAQDNASDLSVSEAKLKSLNGGVNPSVISLNPNGSQDNWADEWARHMASADCNASIAGVQNVITYALDIGPSETVDGGQGPGWTALLKSMAVNGKGKYFAINNNDANTASNIAAALNTIFTEVQAVNSVFASTTLPVSVNVRGTNLNQVYIGVFRPDAEKNPRWLGNLKMYKLQADTATNTVFLADANSVRAENSTTGFISNTATSYWTSDSCFWSYLGADPNSSAAVPASCVVPTSYTYWSDKPDGDKVEKGGAAQRLRSQFPMSQATRKVYTCTSAGSGICTSGDYLSATPFSAGATGYPANNTNIAAADLGAYTTYPVVTIGTTPIDASSSTATVTLSGTFPSFVNGDTVRIEGATPSAFNGDYAIANVDSGAKTFTYTLPTVLSGTTALVTLAGHTMNTNDQVYVIGANPSAYDRAYAPVTRVNANSFSYQLSTSASGPVTNSPTFWSLKFPNSVFGSGSTATISLPNHGYGANGTVLTNIWVWYPNEDAFRLSSGSVTVVNPDTLTYTTPVPITGAANRAQVTTTAAHMLKVGDLVTITGGTNAVGSYNCTDCPVIAVIDANNFTYAPAVVPTGAATGTLNVSAKRVFTNLTINNGATNPTRSNMTVTAPTGTTLDVNTTNWTVTISGATTATFNATGRTLTAVPSTTVANYTVTGNPAAGTTLTPTASGTVTFNRTTLTTGITINPVVTATGTIRLWRIINPTSIAAQTSATGTITAGRPSDADATQRANIINWVLGRDNAEGEQAPGSSPAATTDTDVRGSIHGDVLHSRPAVVNYNRNGDDNDIYAFYGANDGMLRALKGGLASSGDDLAASVSPGDERWAFVPREFFPYFKRLRNNSPDISSSNPRNYLADGPIGVYQLDANNDSKLTVAGGDKVHLFYAFRRGGRFIYALDATDPAAPKFLWRKKSNGTVVGSDTGYSELGYTWSEPKVAKLRIDVSGTIVSKTVLIFGGGYDPIVDDINPCLLEQSTSTGITVKAIGTGSIEYTAAGSCVVNNATGSSTTRTRSMGRAIYVVDASDGSVIFQAGPAPVGATVNKTVTNMTCAIPSDITVVDIDREGHADRGYVGDTCGQVWRIDLTDTNPANWSVFQIGAVSSSTATDIANKRKFLFPPDVVFSTDGTGQYAAILLGSGDREHPFSTNTVDRFYMFKDRTASGAFQSLAACAASGVANDPIGDGNLYDATDTAGNNDCGFKLTLATGEKNIGSAVTIAGTTFFNTNQPSSSAGGGSCGSNLGIARQYLIDFEDASATTDLNATGVLNNANRSSVYPGGGFLPSPVPAIVDLSGKKYQVVISGTSVKTPAGATLDTRTRTYWYKEFD